ncbi:hypothetical protein [Streptomyces sp. NBC_01217]|uniref:hypothetical protein n=1 Tax=Streptomyces sp. NBC_01217 TaxID=2903779 RepID=UPI002E15AB91|nr:hypothetical protein OG507_32720 [Streptomyces sp. NBC_01217]
MTTPPSSRKSALSMGLFAVAACAVCCAGPLLAVLGGIGAASVIGAIWIPALAVVAVAAVVAALWLHRRRQKASACRSGPGPVDVDMPTRIPSDRDPGHLPQ